MRMPARSTATSTGMSGFSSVSYTSVSCSLASISRKIGASWTTRSARSPAYVTAASTGKSASDTDLAPRPQTSSSFSAL